MTFQQSEIARNEADLAANQSCPSRWFTWEEIGLRTGHGDYSRERWLVVDRKVYDISRFYKKHPGGSRIICGYAGQDATDPFTAFHLDKTVVKKHMAPLLIGELAPDQPSLEPNKNKLLVEDFRELLSTVKKMGLFKSSKVFFFLMLLHILLLDVAGCFVLWYFGISITSLVIGTVLLVFSKSQAGWLQHDLGHLSVFSNPKWNHLSQEFVSCYLLGLSASWWSSRHSAHHAKPNCFQKDPDVASHPLVFSLGKPLSLELGLQKKRYMLYNHQHKYFSFMMPMIILATSQFFTFYKIFQDKLWRELAWTLGYYIRTFISFLPLFGFKSTLVFVYISRFLELTLFAWISQMNHIPMHIDHDKNMDWFSTQLQATCNVNQSFFNDWFTGHLNFQIEHHLFPMMPRHNYWKVAPLVKSMCAKHGIEYQSKPLFTALADIVHSLKVAGEIWYKAYHFGEKIQNPKSCLQQGKKGEETR